MVCQNATQSAAKARVAGLIYASYRLCSCLYIIHRYCSTILTQINVNEISIILIIRYPLIAKLSYIDTVPLGVGRYEVTWPPPRTILKNFTNTSGQRKQYMEQK